MKVIKIIFVALVLIVTTLAGLIAFQPSSYSVTRTSETIRATPGEVFGYINDFQQWKKWAPWFSLDPNMVQTYSGATSGKGAVYHWKSKDDSVGEGNMEIVSSIPPKSVDIQLDFIAPFQSKNMSLLRVEETQGGGSKVSWTMTGPSDYTTKIMTFFGMMDSMIGKDFEQGLAKLKTVAENEQ